MLCHAGKRAVISYVEKNLRLDFNILLSLPELLTKIFSDFVKAEGPASSIFEECKKCQNPEGCFFNFLADPLALREEVEKIISSKVVEVMERAALARLGKEVWENTDVVFAFVWLLARKRYSLKNAKQLASGIAFLEVEAPIGVAQNFVVVAASTTEEFFKRAVSIGIDATYVFYPYVKNEEEEVVLNSLPVKAVPVWKVF